MEVGRWDKKNNHRLHAILRPHYTGVHFLKNIEWSLSVAGKPRVLAINGLLHSLAALTATFSAVGFYCQLYDAKPPSKLKIISPGGLPQLSGPLPQQPGAPHLLVNRPLKIAFTLCLACSRLRDGGGKSFSNKKCEKRATAPFPKSCASYFRFARFNTFPLYYLRAWHRLRCVSNIIPKSPLFHLVEFARCWGSSFFGC